MSNSIYLRPLAIEDAKVSYQWRNNPQIWKYSRFVPTNTTTLEAETRWLAESLEKKDQVRFAICVENSHTYIGNVQLIKMSNIDAEFHLFIGDTDWWGKGIGRKSTNLLLNYAFLEKNLQKVFLEVHRENLPAITIYSSQGFENKDLSFPYNVMELTSTRYISNQTHQYEKNYYATTP
ncbi:GNAT family N-acetyltransferase [Pedobacter immunditicola]|uniref:GNAT family N-acetyltransferase n=1 Tax=Pedobacter immunditicola TaxID=3133440 RepID=UPI00309BA038